MKKDISVIVPCFNVENYIDGLLHSLTAQTIGVERLELIFVDDASTDQTVEKLEEWERRYEDSILVVRCTENGRQGTARNIGLSYAEGDFICFIDADDEIALNMLEILYRLIIETECDLVQFRYCNDRERIKNIFYEGISYKVYDFSKHDNRKKYCMNSEILNESCTTKFYRRELLLRAGVKYAEHVAYEEPLFTYPLNFFVNRACVTETAFYLYQYNEFGTTAMHMSRLSTIAEHLQVQTELLGFLRRQTFYTEYQNEIELHFIYAYYVSVFYFLKYRGIEEIPVPLFRIMCDSVRKIIPNYEENPYWEDVSLVKERQFVDLIKLEQDWTDEEVRENLARILSAIKN